MSSILQFDVWQTTGGANVGTVLQTVTQHSGFVNQTIVSTTPIALTNMSVTITPFYADSKIFIQAMVNASWTYVASAHIFRNGVNIIPAHGGNNQSGGTNALITAYNSAQETARANQVFAMPIVYLDTPGSTSPQTYSIHANSGWSGGTETFYFNNRDSLDMLGSSFISVWEIKS
jgi:hypothetical protein